MTAQLHTAVTPGEQMILEALDRKDQRDRDLRRKQDQKARSQSRRLHLVERTQQHMLAEIEQMKTELRDTRIQVAMAVHSR